MYKNVLQSIENIEIWPIISLVIFFLFFLTLLWWVVKVDRKFIDYMKKLPMDDNTKSTADQTSNIKSV